MANIDQTGCSDEFNSSFGSTNSSELVLSKPVPETPDGGSDDNQRSEPSDEIIMDVPFVTSPGQAAVQAGPSVSKGKDLSLLLTPGKNIKHLENHFILGKEWLTPRRPKGERRPKQERRAGSSLLPKT